MRSLGHKEIGGVNGHDFGQNHDRWKDKIMTNPSVTVLTNIMARLRREPGPKLELLSSKTGLELSQNQSK